MRRTTIVLLMACLTALAGCGDGEPDTDGSALPAAEPSGGTGSTPAAPAAPSPTPGAPRSEQEVRDALESAYEGGTVLTLSLREEECAWLGDDGEAPVVAEKNDSTKHPYADEWLCRFGDGIEAYRATQVLPDASETPPDRAACEGLANGTAGTGPELQLNLYYCVTTGGTRTVLHVREDGDAYQLLYVSLEKFSR